MAELDAIANYAEIIGAILVVGGLAFAVLEIRRTREQRHRDAAFEVFRNLASKEFLQGLAILYEMPEGLSKKQLEERYGDGLADLTWVLGQFEDMGVLVHDHVLPIELAENFYQVSIVNCWKKLGNYIEELRAQMGKPQLYNGIEWLAKLVELRDRDLTQSFSDPAKWRPR